MYLCRGIICGKNARNDNNIKRIARMNTETTSRQHRDNPSANRVLLPISILTICVAVGFLAGIMAGRGCLHRQGHVVQSQGEIILIDSTLDAIQDSDYIAYLAPIKAQLEEELRVPIGYAPEALTVRRPECTMLNWACDALLAMARQRYTGDVDMAVTNIGGMRCEWAAGDITFKDVFELMPFDNELVVLTMSGTEVLNLCQAFARLGGEGVAGLRMKARNHRLIEATIEGRAIDPDATYTVATSDYLSQGNDHMEPLACYTEIWHAEEKIRDLYIEYIERVHTVEAVVDGRMDVR